MSFAYQIKRSRRRKTVAICVKPDGSVRILVPSILPDKNIAALVQKKSTWIRSKIARFQEMQSLQLEKHYVSGESLSYLGETFKLQIAEGTAGEITLARGSFHVQLPKETADEARKQYIKEKLESWYRQQALKRLLEQTGRYAEKIGVVPSSVGIKGYRSRWGSCHSDGRIYFNWRIILAPPFVIDYLVVHELCHLLHANHSRNFWRCVERMLPDYAERRKWLKAHGRWLEI